MNRKLWAAGILVLVSAPIGACSSTGLLAGDETGTTAGPSSTAATSPAEAGRRNRAHPRHFAIGSADTALALGQLAFLVQTSCSAGTAG